MRRNPAGLRSVVALTVLLVSQCGALAGPVDATYSITLAGLTIGKASLAGVVDSGSYKINISAGLTGLAGAVAGGSGSGTAQGAIGGPGVLSNGFAVTASNGKLTRTISIGASAGSVRGVSIDPPLELPMEGRVPLRPQHQVGILDPISALIMPVRGTDPFDKANCERRLPVFDGTQRFDIQLSYVGLRNVKSDTGYSGPVLVCAARYVPIAGHRPDRRAIKFMVENRNIDTWLAPVNGGRVLMPYRISVRTMIGNSVIEARSFNSTGP
ncbi:Protein of unknown function DUF3108 [Rhabdaerophilaceae bacterium]